MAGLMDELFSKPRGTGIWFEVSGGLRQNWANYIMPAPSSEAVIHALSGVIAFGHKVGLEGMVSRLERFREEFEKTKPTLKRLQGEVANARDEAFIAIRAHLHDEALNPRAGHEAHSQEMHEVFRGLSDVIYPPKFLEKAMPTTGFAGAEFVEKKAVRYLGAAEGVKPIFEASVALTRSYCELVGRRELAQAYEHTSLELRGWMNFKSYQHAHERAAARYGGWPTRFGINSFVWIFPDNEARQNGEVGALWPRHVPKPIRRAMVYGFWLGEGQSETGCYGSLWITESSGQLQIAKFDFTDD